MIQLLSKLKVGDNSGAKLVKCIKVLKGSKPKYASIGDIIVVSIIKLLKNSKLKKGDIYYGLIVSTTKKFKRSNGTFLKSNDNLVILLNKEKNVISSRIFTGIPYEINKKTFPKLYSLAPFIY